ncbi:sulfatase [Helcococcus kunzii]|uniref:sulfatase n=1 Tax=Helcococcus kunzii TaxID=40091 RepID=UPI0024AE4AAD|nr:sulfatase [Helcococcus kunzii]
MRAIMVMFDSLNRHMLSPYGNQWIKTPNFDRLSKKSVTFDNNYSASLPCMPARRDLHTGRYNFLHRSWGPIEPYDDSMPEILKKNGIHSHLVTDHQHYWEDGGATYHTRYSTFELIRGQEGDPWKGHINEEINYDTEIDYSENPLYKQDQINRQYMEKEENHPQALTFKYGIDFIEINKNEDNWFLQIETFDPHEPFFSYEEYKKLYPHDYKGKHFDWPPYYFVQEDQDVVEHGKYEYAAVLSMCDKYLGKVLDVMDKYNMWEDTLLIVNTDHGYLLGEHGWWSKTVMPVYNEISHIPLFIWDPRYKLEGVREESLVQTIDLAPTILDYFNIDIPESMKGKPLRYLFENKGPIRDAALFGYHGGHVNITDGKYVLMKGPVSPDNKPLFEYTLMPTHMRERFSVEEVKNLELSAPFEFTKGVTPLKIESGKGMINPYKYGDKLFDIVNDPKQTVELEDDELTLILTKKLIESMKDNDAPIEQYTRLGLNPDKDITLEDVIERRKLIEKNAEIPELASFKISKSVKNQIFCILNITPLNKRKTLIYNLRKFLENNNKKNILESDIFEFKDKYLKEIDNKIFTYFIKLSGRTH